eukprot:IDg10210t1
MATIITIVLLVCIVSITAHASDYEKAGSLKLQNAPVSRFWKSFRKKASASFKKLKSRIKQFIRGKPNRDPPLAIGKPGAKTNVRYLALGDSYASGVGSGGSKLPVKKTDFDRCCYRLSSAYPNIIAKQLGASSIDFRACM